MILEGIFEVAFQLIVRLAAFIFVEIIAHILFYFTGHAIIKLVTLGKHPKFSRLENTDSKSASHIIFVGMLFWLTVIVILIAANWG